LHKNFSEKFGEIRANILRSPEGLPAPTPMMKRHFHRRCRLFERTKG